mmetsp:Transcript_2363/g.4806  ORF Transcript_2363/g.4806 Transcript_2363/m.4806 type:complete len:206 (-) Transcript_2363:19-636(-)
MLPNLVQIRQAGVLLFHERAHTTKCSLLQRLAPIQRIGVLHHPHVVFRYLVDKVPRHIQLSQSQLVVVLVVQNIEQVCVKRMNIVDTGELVEDCGELLVPVLLRILHLAHVKLTDARYRISLMHHRRRFPLCFREDDIDKVLRSGHHPNLLEVIVNHRVLPATSRQKCAPRNRTEGTVPTADGALPSDIRVRNTYLYIFLPNHPA